MTDPDPAAAAASDVLRPGTRVGRYVVEARLGRGRMGDVYAATDGLLERRVALKLVRLDVDLVGSMAEEAKARFLREARATASLEHPNVVGVYDVGEHEGVPFLAMELVLGESLRARMQTPLANAEALRILVDVARGLEAAHEKRIVHRDVKPENVMIRRDGVAKVLDFGIARRAAFLLEPGAPTELDGYLGTITGPGAMIGTPRYMAPEQLRGDALDGRADQFAFGLVAYELFAGKHPWDTEAQASLVAAVLEKQPTPLLELAPATPRHVVQVIERALAKEPADRFATMGDVVEALEQKSKPARVRPAKSWRWWWLLALLVTLGGGIAAARAWAP